MPNKCAICTHPHSAAIELALARGMSLDLVSQRFEVPRNSAHRHRTLHMSDRLKAQLFLDLKKAPMDIERMRKERTENWLADLIGQMGRAWGLLNAAEEAGDLTTACRVHGVLARLHEIEAKHLAMFDRTVPRAVSIVVLPEWIQFRHRLLAALRQYPEARRAISKLMAEAEQPAEIEGTADGPVSAV